MPWPFSKADSEVDARPLYDTIVAEARRPDWYRSAGIEDSLDGRFAVLSSMLALVDLRLGDGGDEARALSPRLTEVFIADMDAQMRQQGFGDPGLGKQVRMLVGALASRIDRLGGKEGEEWDAAAAACLYRGEDMERVEVELGVAMLRQERERIARTSDSVLTEGRLA
jgi:cytochrome b pre-mRNA-processing protein 3